MGPIATHPHIPHLLMFPTFRASFIVRLYPVSFPVSHARFYTIGTHGSLRNACNFTVQHRRLNTVETEGINVSHSRFLSEASPGERWEEESNDEGEADIHAAEDKLAADGKGKISPTSSHLFKLILPLQTFYKQDYTSSVPPTIFLLHPSQPLSHVSRLILASLPASSLWSHPNASVSFQSTVPHGTRLQWSESTDVGDFLRDAARSAEFQIAIRFSAAESNPQTDSTKDNDRTTTARTDSFIIPVTVPTFAVRTRFLRRRLAAIDQELGQMESLKERCDLEAHKGARRMAVTGFGVLVVYWGAVARLTFWDYGWDIMEPITYLSGLSTVILGYLWFLYQGREVSYSSVLARSISARKHALYSSHGFDFERWQDLIEERRKIRKEIDRIRGEYDETDKQDDQNKKREGKVQEDDDTPAEDK